MMCSGRSVTTCSSKITTYPVTPDPHAFKVLIVFIFFAVLFLFKCVIMKCLNFVIRRRLRKIPKFFSLIMIGSPASHLGGLCVLSRVHTFASCWGSGHEPPDFVGSLLKEKTMS